MVSKLDTALGLLAGARNTFADLAREPENGDSLIHLATAANLSAILSDYHDN